MTSSSNSSLMAQTMLHIVHRAPVAVLETLLIGDDEIDDLETFGIIDVLDSSMTSDAIEGLRAGVLEGLIRRIALVHAEPSPAAWTSLDDALRELLAFV